MRERPEPDRSRIVATTFTRDFGRMNPPPALSGLTLTAIA